MSIPKIIHLCWFGKNDYPEMAKRCIASWKEYLKDYDIRLCNEDNFDINRYRFTKQAYEEHKWAFVSDYARLVMLYEYGGVYMDTDLEVIKDFSPLLEGERYVSSYLEGGVLTGAFIACEPHHPFIKSIIDYYESELCNADDGKFKYIMNPLILTKTAIEKYGFDMRSKSFSNNDITILPYEYFMAYRRIPFGEKNEKWHYHITNNTYTLHHDMSSWRKQNRLRKIIIGLVRMITPEKIYMKFKIHKYNAMIKRDL